MDVRIKTKKKNFSTRKNSYFIFKKFGYVFVCRKDILS